MATDNSCISTGAIPKSKFTDVHKEVEYLDNLTETYLGALQRDIEINETEQNRLTSEIVKIKDVMQHLKDLSTQPEWPNAFVPVNPLAYVPATIIHTSEHYIKLGPDAYTLTSLHETLNFLGRKLERTQKTLDAFRLQHAQLEERSKFSFEMALQAAETAGMPYEIVSDKGVAHKTASGFYEVLEIYNEDDEAAFHKQRQQCKATKGKQKRDTIKEIDVLFSRLDELEKQENLQKELVEPEKGNFEMSYSSRHSINDSITISDRIKSILRHSGLYKMMLEDDLIQQYCHENKTALEVGCDAATAVRNESVLNELLVEALINVPVYSDSDRIDDSCSEQDVFQTVSNNDVAAAFLDSIENNIRDWHF